MLQCLDMCFFFLFQEKWKDYRKAILNSIEDQITIYSKQYECCESQAPPELQEKFNRLILDTKESVTFDSGENDMLVFIIDDNMYYSGMRYEFYQLARKCKCGNICNKFENGAGKGYLNY